jgi:predicted phage tail protein
LEWDGPLLAEPPAFDLEASATPGGAAVFSTRLPETHQFAAHNVPPGTVYVRVYAISSVNGVELREPSNEVQVVVGGAGCARPPDTPVNFERPPSPVELPNQVQIVWSAAPTGCFTDRYIMQVGSAPGASDILTISQIRSDAGQGFVAIAPVGRYFVRVMAANAHGVSAPTNDLEVVIGGSCSMPPGAPGAFTATVTVEPSGLNDVEMRWTAPTTGGAVSFYRINAGSGPGLANIASLNTPFLSDTRTAVPAGTYYLRVHAVDACGQQGPASNEVRITTP